MSQEIAALYVDRERERERIVVVAKRSLTSAIAVAPKLFDSPCKLITTFKSSNISRRSSLRTERERERLARKGGG